MNSAIKWAVLSVWVAASASACVGGDDEDPNSEELVVFNGGQGAIRDYGRTMLANPGVDCSAAIAAGGTLPILQMVTGQYAVLTGIAAVADDTVTIPGASSSHTADGGLALGAAALWNGTTLQFGGTLLGQYVVPMGTTMPATEQEADQMFDEAFGPAARGGASLSTKRMGGGDRPRIAAWYTVGQAVQPGGDQAPYTYAYGIVRVEAQVLAVHTTGFGNWQSFVE
jgi:hypothetical protein